MKVCINYTVYLGESEYDGVAKYIADRHNEIIKELDYDLCFATIGKHVNAERIHIHYHTICDIKDNKVFKDKGLVSKIKRLKCYSDHLLPYKDFKIPEVKISVNYDNDISFELRKILAYPFKEYVRFDEIDVNYCVGLSEQQLEDFRKYANSIYEKSQKEYQKKEKSKTKKDDLYSHLDTVIIQSNMYEMDDDIQTIVRYVVKQMLIYYKENNKNFSIHQLKNQAINYLYFRDIISENQICNYINI